MHSGPEAQRAHLQHHFEDVEQQFDSAIFGTWVFLVTEIMFFSGMFLAYILYRSWYPDAFAHASHHLDVTMGTINTLVLIGSSYTVVMAVHSAQHGKTQALLRYLLTTIGLGLTFLVIKGFEYHHKFVDGLVPGPNFSYTGPDAPQQELFFSIYFAMTGLHALHMIIGVGLFSWLVLQTLRGQYSEEYFTPIECTGLYWHFVDLVWIFLFPLLYLIGRH